MPRLTIAFLIVSLLVGIGQFLDGYVRDPALARIRSTLQSFYVFLYNMPKRLKTLLVDLWDSGYTPRRFDIRTGRPIKDPIPFNWFWFIFVPIFLFVGHHEASHFGWWWDMTAIIVVTIVAPLILRIIVILLVILAFLPFLIILLLLESIRKIVLLIVYGASDPQRRPFTYFTGILAVMYAILDIIREMLKASH